MVDTPSRNVMLARWESRKGAHWVILFEDTFGFYCFRSISYSGTFAPTSYFKSDADAIAEFERTRTGDFQPDSNKTPMRRTYG